MEYMTCLSAIQTMLVIEINKLRRVYINFKDYDGVRLALIGGRRGVREGVGPSRASQFGNHLSKMFGHGTNWKSCIRTLVSVVDKAVDKAGIVG